MSPGVTARALLSTLSVACDFVLLGFAVALARMPGIPRSLAAIAGSVTLALVAVAGWASRRYSRQVLRPARFLRPAGYTSRSRQSPLRAPWRLWRHLPGASPRSRGGAASRLHIRQPYHRPCLRPLGRDVGGTTLANRGSGGAHHDWGFHALAAGLRRHAFPTRLPDRPERCACQERAGKPPSDHDYAHLAL
jgi:hypothetical protein